MLRAFAARLPEPLRLELKRHKHLHELRRGRFVSPEPEFLLLHEWVGPGDWVLDLGANVGHYTARLSALVGPRGRVLAFEPIAESCAILTAVAGACPDRNVTVLNAAASDRVGTVPMAMPAFRSGTRNFYQASIGPGPDARQVLTLPVDALELPTIRLAKIDVEGHEAAVLRGMERLLRRDRPTLIVERGPDEARKMLEQLGYEATRLPGSPNLVLQSPAA